MHDPQRQQSPASHKTRHSLYLDSAMALKWRKSQPPVKGIGSFKPRWRQTSLKLFFPFPSLMLSLWQMPILWTKFKIDLSTSWWGYVKSNDTIKKPHLFSVDTQVHFACGICRNTSNTAFTCTHVLHANTMHGGRFRSAARGYTRIARKPRRVGSHY